MITSCEINGNIKETKFEIEGVKYKIISTKRTEPTREQKFTSKLQANFAAQEEEVAALALLYKDNFTIDDELNRKYSIKIFIRGAPDVNIQLNFHPEYPSDAPPTYSLNAPWVRKKSLIPLYQALTNIFTENFGRCFMYLWVEKIEEHLKKEIQELKNNPEQETEPHKTAIAAPVTQKEENSLGIFKGTPICDRGSSFTPFLAKVACKNDVIKAIAEIESKRNVATAWRNTYAYRYTPVKGSIVEVGEDGGEPKAGRNLLQRLANYNANNVMVFISRRFGGSLLGSDRFRHLNAAADEVLCACDFKPQQSKSEKGNQQPTKKNKKSKNQK